MISSKLRVAGTKRELETYYNSLKPDEEEHGRASFRVKISRFGKELIVDVKADDFVAYRATMTSILNVMAIVDKTLKATKA